jgi:hypothetical protein
MANKIAAETQGLLGMKSMYDRHHRNTLGNAVGFGWDTVGYADAGESPSNGDYFVDNGASPSSPFKPENGPAHAGFDHMVELMTKNIKSGNGLGMTYHHSPILEDTFQDLNTDMDSFFSGQPTNPTLGQFGGPYVNSIACTQQGGFC